MANILVVIKHEIGVTLRKKSFWILSFIVPAFLLGFQAYYIILERDIDAVAENGEEAQEDTTSTELPVIGLVDDSGLISTFPEGIPPGMFIQFEALEEGNEALETGDVSQLVMIPDDYVHSGEITIYDQDFQILDEGNMGVAMSNANEWMLQYIINYNMIGDAELASVVFNPTPGNQANYIPLEAPEGETEGDAALAEFTSTAIPYIYYFILIIVSGYILQSVTAEKENRTVEVILVSMDSNDLMAGKLLGMTVVALLQLMVWAGGALLIVNQGSRILDVSGLTFTPGFIVAAIVFLILGYLLYASVMAAAGALANNAREAGQVTWILIMPLMPTLMFGRLFVDDPGSALVVFLSLFPFSSPSAMVTRMAVGPVPTWQVLLSLLLLLLSAYFILMMASRFFHPQNLLSEAQFSWKRFATAWRER